MINNYRKLIITTYIIAFTLLFISCGQQDKEKSVRSKYKDTTEVAINNIVQQRLEKRKQVEDEAKIDSIKLDKVLRDAIQIAEENKHSDRFKKHYIVSIPDSSYKVSVDISSDFYFTKKYPHLIIRRNAPNTNYIDIYSKTDKQFYKVLAHEQWILEYTGDTICDTNGDNLKDFVVNWYGVNGCCLKAFSNVYLLRSDKKSFSNSFEFINPTFSPREQLIRGVCYGHPGETEMYKYRWKGETVDTLEYIYYEKNDKGEKTGKVIVSNRLQYRNNHKILKRLKDIPVEYRRIEGYDWFIGNL
ncbi:hypothetical protein QNI16_25270 [Cytophagaceae bacterium YF14B1]|uniref:Lipoprotein n=1 Tax=Xanthocytophaga flava TaxID=3048013 RepID=A0AAE3QV32_9BACT|nr:hypothetical protein [Xanthocytophaga flavus]MDJ1483836.1 hypothetical protein [Xanthocytophaga flavus]